MAAWSGPPISESTAIAWWWITATRLQSIYGHLNRIDVKVGDMVKKDQSLGVAGATGMAGGVHVHFSMQIDGVQVNPREWWDEHWIHDRIMSKLDPNAAQAKPVATAATVTSQPRRHRRR